jgi:hypothetical protein
MTDEQLQIEVPLAGREITVTHPTPEQLLVWQRTLKRLGNLETATWTGEETMAALERLRKIIDSIIVHRADIDWLDDAFLEQTVGFRELAPWITQVIDAFEQHASQSGTRAERRAAAKPKKATRRKAS